MDHQNNINKQNDDLLVQQCFDDLMQHCESICKTHEDAQRIRNAFNFANDAHRGVKRKSGEPYITHPIAVAKIIVTEIGLGVKSVMAALLHDVVEDTDYTVEDIQHHFGAKVASMVDGLTKLSGVVAKGSSEQAENFKKMLLTLSDDIRVIIIKLADRLHNMRTLGSMPLHKQMKIASETIYLFAPLAHRLGLYAIKTELEDLSLKYRFPEEYKEIVDKLRDTDEIRQQFVERFNEPIIRKLQENNIYFDISSRVKSIYSIWKKMKRKQISFEEIYDLFAIRIVFYPSTMVPEKSQCWHIYSLITDIYKPKPDRIRDWVNIPKANGYEALHCTVMGQDGTWAEVQIRSKRMDDIAERGFAAHWRYKMGENKSSQEYEMDNWLGQLREALGNTTEDAVEFLDNFQLNLQVSEIVVFTPKGESKTLPKGATALDFAYDIHSKIGDHAIGAKINHKLSTLYTQIQSGDQIEIITSASTTPKPSWLEHAITAKAKNYIKQYLKKDTANSIKTGQELFENEMTRRGINIQARVFRKLLPAYQCVNKDQFYSKLATGLINLNGVDKILRQNSASKIVKYWTLQIASTFGLGNANAKTTSNENQSEHEFNIAECCRPIPGDAIIGFKDASGGVTVHKKNCEVAIKLSAQQGQNIVEAKWSSEKIMSYLAVIELRGLDRMGMMLDVAKLITDELNVNIRALDFQSHDGIFDGRISLYVRNNDDLKKIIHKVGQIKGVDKINRIENNISQ